MDHEKVNKRVTAIIARQGRLRVLLAERFIATPVPLEHKQQQDPLHAQDAEQASNQKRTKVDVITVLPEKSRQAMLGAPTVTLEHNQEQDGPRAKDAEQDTSQTLPELDAKPVVTDFSRQETTGAEFVQQDTKQKRTNRDASRVLPDGMQHQICVSVANVMQDSYQLLLLLRVHSALQASMSLATLIAFSVQLGNIHSALVVLMWLVQLDVPLIKNFAFEIPTTVE